MGLIDVQLVLKLIEDIQYDDRYSNNDEVFVALETVRDCVFNLPTAYDVDRVIDELHSSSNKGVFKSCDFSELIGSISYKGAFISIENAVDIVKRGGTGR